MLFMVTRTGPDSDDCPRPYVVVADNETQIRRIFKPEGKNGWMVVPVTPLSLEGAEAMFRDRG